MKTISSDFVSSLKDFSCTGKPEIVLVEKAEADLGLRFAEDYRNLALQCGAISFYGHHITGISPYPGNDVVRVTKEFRSFNDEFPANMYVIEEAHIDGIVVLQDPSGTIFQMQPNTKPKQIFDCLYDYLANLT